MKKILVILALLIGLMWSITFVLLPKIENKIDEMTPVSGSGSIDEKPGVADSTLTEEQEIELDSQDIVRKKIDAIRKRLALKGLIIEGDSYYRDGQLALALKKYLEFYRQNPSDALITEKLGDTYFEMKKFSSASNYYLKAPDASDEMIRKGIKSLVLNTKINDPKSTEKTLKSLSEAKLSAEQLFYYQTSLSCAVDFHECKIKFGEYFWQEENLESGSGSQNIEITYPQLGHIKDAITNYKNFQVDDVYLKNAYIIGAWYSDGLYNLSAYMGEQLLTEKINYKPILKIVAQSYFELGQYEKSRDVLGQYYEIDDEDAGVTYLLGVVNTRLREYVLANIYFNKALDLGYKGSSNIHRQLIHNFYVLENDTAMLESFDSLIEESDFTSNDLSLGIYYHIIHEEYPKALDWSKKGKELFGSETGIFHTYEGWILTEMGKYQEAREILQVGYELDGENPFVLINFAYNALAREEKGEALIYFKKILTLAPNSEFATNAAEEIKKISQK